MIIDGTWHQAKTIVRDVPQLWDLPCYQLTPSSPGQYRIRREPDAQSLSTLEATVEALQALESDTVGLDQLLSAFHVMVENQLAHSDIHAVRRRKQTRPSRRRYLPHALLQDAASLVVAYGEATPGQSGKHGTTPTLVNWFAQRLGTSERFSCHMRQQQSLSDAALEQMRLSAADFNTAISQDEFRDRWNHFLRRNDVLIVYHQRTLHRLRQMIDGSAANSPQRPTGAWDSRDAHCDPKTNGHAAMNNPSQPRCLVLKSIFKQWRPDFRSLEELIAAEGMTLPISEDKSRANQRLDMAVARSSTS